ncbi:unnamed protein product [Mytilus edulis]|uniref:Uncharacterized protein n=1 Tax=Mytilus edulis TaxID=6550 RepID=A0A8S3UHD5_MYTED|nr:unnamed protein product [Mytilus edulis]
MQCLFRTIQKERRSSEAQRRTCKKKEVLQTKQCHRPPILATTRLNKKVWDEAVPSSSQLSHDTSQQEGCGDEDAYEIHLKSSKTFKNKAMENVYGVTFNEKWRGQRLLDIHASLMKMFEDVIREATRGNGYERPGHGEDAVNPLRKSTKKNSREQRELAAALTSKVGLPLDRPCTITDISVFEDVLHLRILVIDSALGNRFCRIEHSRTDHVLPYGMSFYGVFPVPQVDTRGEGERQTLNARDSLSECSKYWRCIKCHKTVDRRNRNLLENPPSAASGPVKIVLRSSSETTGVRMRSLKKEIKDKFSSF